MTRLIARMRTNLAKHLRLMLIADDRLFGLARGVELADLVRAGVTAVQLRFKSANDRVILDRARRIVGTCAVPVLINDRPDLARLSGAAGVHLGPDDVSVMVARAVLGADAVVGSSVGSVSEVERGRSADYWGVGPWRETLTKPDAGEPVGLAAFRTLVTAAAGKPCIAIGGIAPGDVAAVLDAGGAGVAVAGGVLDAPDPVAAVAAFREALM